MAIKVEALILDLDGVVIWRPGYQTKATSDYKKEGVNIYTPPSNIVNLEEEIKREKLGLMDAGAFVWHHMRWVYPDVAKTLKQVEGVDILCNTGRFDQRIWRWMTQFYLRAGGIPDETFQEIHFRPKGMATRDSKIAYVAHKLKTYNRVRVADDNPADLLPILRQFPDQVEGILVRDWSTNTLLARVNRRDYPTLKVVSRLRDGVQDLLV